MPKLHCYVSDVIASQLQHKTEQSQTSVSKYLADLVEKDLKTQWPEDFFDFFDLFGAWKGEPLVREHRFPLNACTANITSTVCHDRCFPCKFICFECG